LTIQNDDNISKKLLISYLNKKLEDNPICEHNEFTHEFSKGYRKSLTEILGLLK
jgi:hypothetical protein